jgi:hypothetical protein
VAALFKYYFAIVDYRYERYATLYCIVMLRNERLVLVLNVHTGEHTQIYRVPIPRISYVNDERPLLTSLAGFGARQGFLFNIPISHGGVSRRVSLFTEYVAYGVKIVASERKRASR